MMAIKENALIFKQIERRSRFVTLPWKRNFWMMTNRKGHSKVCLQYFKLVLSYSLSFYLANLGEIFFGGISIFESDSFCVVFTYFIKRARELRKLRVIVVEMYKIV